MFSLDLAEAREVSERAARGDAEAIAFLSSLFPDTEPCLLCDEPVGAEGTILMLPDPKARGWAIVAAECLRCAGSPQRHQREVAVLKGMFPRSNFHAPRDAQPGYLRGPRIKRRPSTGRTILPR